MVCYSHNIHSSRSRSRGWRESGWADDITSNGVCDRKCNYPDFIVIIMPSERVVNAIKCSLWGYYERQDVDGFNGLSLANSNTRGGWWCCDIGTGSRILFCGTLSCRAENTYGTHVSRRRILPFQPPTTTATINHTTAHTPTGWSKFSDMAQCQNK